MKRCSVFGDEKFQSTSVARCMFLDRAKEFIDKKGWNLERDDAGFEFDAYDNLSPYYVIVSNASVQHLASARLMPLSGRTMSQEIFGSLFPSGSLTDERAWEVSRFFGAKGAGREALQNLMLAGLEFGVSRGIETYLGVTSAQLLPVYKRLGWPPQVLGRGVCKDGPVLACRWSVNVATLLKLLGRLNAARGTESSPIAEAQFVERV